MDIPYIGQYHRIGAELKFTPSGQPHPLGHFKGIIVSLTLGSNTSSLLINTFPEHVQRT